ncbi:hypothetical protein LTR95_019565, partial [Oleoguttula sp. CCFEE 5521]
MPVVWNAETEAKLLAALFKVTDLKVTQAQMKEIAEIVSPECTAKAISHRIAKFRNQAAGFAGKGASETPGTPKGPKTVKKAAGRKRRGKEVEEGEGEDQDDDEDVGVGKRAKIGEDREGGGDEEG